MPAIQRPNAQALILCQLVIVEDKTHNVTLANSLQKLTVKTLPSETVPFSVYTILTDGLGVMELDLVVLRCDTLDEIYRRSARITSGDPLRQWRVWWKVRSCSFPVAGRYQFVLEMDGEPITQCILEVIHKGVGHD